MNLFFHFLIFIIILFMYLHVVNQLKTSEDLEMTFDYSFLAPPIDESMSESEQQELIDRQARPETECLWYMGQLKTHR